MKNFYKENKNSNDNCFPVFKEAFNKLVDDRIKETLHDFLVNGLKNISEELIKPQEAAKILKCSESTLCNWEQNGLLNPKRLGGKKYYRYTDLVKLLIPNVTNSTDINIKNYISYGDNF